MKSFYISALLIVAALIVSPIVFLGDVFREEHPRDETVYWSTYGSAVKSIDPATCGDVTSATVQGNVYESLYCYHYLKRPLEVVPQLADSFPRVSDEGLTYTIRIAPGILYHRNACFGRDPGDGSRWATREVSAKDFELAFKRVADYHINTGLAWAFLAGRIRGLDEYRAKTKQYNIGDFSRYDLGVEGVQALDERTLRIRLKEPFPQFIYVLALNVYAPVPREAVDYWLTTEYDTRGRAVAVPMHERSPEFRRQEQVVGTGPYILTTWKRKWKFIYERNPDFRGEYYPSEGQPSSEDWPGDSAMGLLDDAGKPVPFLNHIYLRYVEETYASWMLFLSRQQQVTGIPRETFESVITPSRELARRWKRRHINLVTTTDPSIYWIVFNMEDPVLGASRALRQGLCLGYDVESEIQILLNGRGRRAVNVVPSAFKGHQEAGPGPYYRYDPEAARRKIEEAKQELAAAGQLQNGDLPLLTLDLGDGPYYVRMADIARQQFTLLGLKLKVVFNDWPTLQRKVENKQVQMYTMGWHADYPDAENFLQLYYSGNIDKGTNNSNYSNALFDSLYERVRTMPDTPERTAIYARMIAILSEDCPALLLHEPQDFYLYYEWMKNFKPHPIGYGFTKYRRIDTGLRERLWGDG
jgi:oligopeptide transport system substrate-binding protein